MFVSSTWFPAYAYKNKKVIDYLGYGSRALNIDHSGIEMLPRGRKFQQRVNYSIIKQLKIHCCGVWAQHFLRSDTSSLTLFAGSG